MTKDRNRDVAQLASAPRSGRGGRKFESSHPDFERGENLQKFPPLLLYDDSYFKPYNDKFQDTLFSISYSGYSVAR